MSNTRPPYPPEFRGQMVELVRSGRSPEELAGEFEPSAVPFQTRVGSEILCVSGGCVHRGRIMAFGHGRVFTPRYRFVRFGRKAEIGVSSQNRLVPAENRGAGRPDSRPLNLQVQTLGT